MTRFVSVATLILVTVNQLLTPCNCAQVSRHLEMGPAFAPALYSLHVCMQTLHTCDCCECQSSVLQRVEKCDDKVWDINLSDTAEEGEADLIISVPFDGKVFMNAGTLP